MKTSLCYCSSCHEPHQFRAGECKADPHDLLCGHCLQPAVPIQVDNGYGYVQAGSQTTRHRQLERESACCSAPLVLNEEGYPKEFA